MICLWQWLPSFQVSSYCDLPLTVTAYISSEQLLWFAFESDCYHFKWAATVICLWQWLLSFQVSSYCDLPLTVTAIISSEQLLWFAFDSDCPHFKWAVIVICLWQWLPSFQVSSYCDLPLTVTAYIFAYISSEQLLWFAFDSDCPHFKWAVIVICLWQWLPSFQVSSYCDLPLTVTAYIFAYISSEQLLWFAFDSDCPHFKWAVIVICLWQWLPSF